MIGKLSNRIKSNPIGKYIWNKYALIFVVFAIWMLFLDNYSYLEHRVLDQKIDELETNKQFYKSEIKKDCLQIKKLKNINEVERYAREKYYMKRENEVIYIIESDTIKK